MPLAVVCPECHAQFRVPDHFEGQRGKCPKCKATFLAQRAPAPRDTPTTASLADESVDTSAKPRGKAIPKPRLLEKMMPPAAPQVPAAETAPKKLKRAVATDAPMAPPPPPAPPKPARPDAKPSKVGGESSQNLAPELNFTSITNSGATKVTSTKPSESGGAKVYPHRRAKKSKLPMIIGVGTVLLIGIAMIGGGIAMSMFNIDPLAVLQQGGGQNAATDDAQPATASNADDDLPTGTDEAPAIDAQLANWSNLRPALVTINVIDRGNGTRAGNGFLLPNHLVVTTAELFAGVEGAVVTLGDNRRYEVAGVIERPQYGLALLKLDRADQLLPQLAVGEATPAAGTIVFIGDAAAATPTRLAKRIAVAGLPAALRPAMPERMRDNDALELIEHAGRTARTADGRFYETPAGAPLLNSNGQVVGVNLALGGDSRKGYAVGVEQLTQLLAASVSSEFRLLPLGGMASIDVPPTTLNPLGVPVPVIPPQPTSELATAIAALAAQADALSAKKWKAETAGDYLAIAAFAHNATELTAKIDKLDAAQRAIERPQVEAELTKLADADWPGEAAATVVNDFAIADLPSDTPGVFAYGRCLLRPEDFGDRTVDGLPLFAFELVGTSGLVVLPIGENGANIAAGSEWLILGTKDMTQSIGITLAGADMARDARIIHTKFLLQRPAAADEPVLDLSPLPLQAVMLR